jgi:putative tryptophan/tyrosine transport system substrate-binding protein
MRRREFIAGLGGAAAWPLAARAQNAAGRMRRVGILTSKTFTQLWTDAFKKGLPALGWMEGHNIRFDERVIDDLTLLPVYAAELARLAPDVIFVTGSPYLQAVRQATSDIPIVFSVVTDPVGQGFVSSLARPGGNITGFAENNFGLSTKTLDLFKKLAPAIEHVGFMYDPLAPNVLGDWAELESAAESLRLKVVKMPVRTPDEIEPAIAGLARQPHSGIYVEPTKATVLYSELITKTAQRHRLPSVYRFRSFVESGGLASYGADPLELSRRAASYVDRILNGEKPRDLPVQLPTKMEFVLNLKTAKAIGLAVPENMLPLADVVIE